MTLKCYSEIVFETFSLVLHRKGLSTDPLYLVGEPCDGGYQANISIAPVTSEHTGTYRCYGFVSLQPYEWSDPSDSLDIKITGENIFLFITLSSEQITVSFQGAGKLIPFGYNGGKKSLW